MFTYKITNISASDCPIVTNILDLSLCMTPLLCGKIYELSVVERKYFTCPNRESNPGRWIYRQTLYHVAVKAGFYRKAVEVYLYIPRPCDIHPLQFEIRPCISWYRNHVNETKGDIYAQNGHRVGYLRWAPLS